MILVMSVKQQRLDGSIRQVKTKDKYMSHNVM